MKQEDYMRKLTDYFRKNLKKGYTPESLKWALISQGYSRTAVERAIEHVHKEMARSAPILKDKPVIKHEIIGEDNQPIPVRKSFWQQIKDFFSD